MSTLLGLALLPVALLWVLPLVSELISLAVRRRSRPAGGAHLPDAGSRLLFLVPAHDEALLIRRCVQALLTQETHLARCETWVVADNCRDDTARIAGEAGANVLERMEPDQPGKPAAIEYALNRMPLDQADSVVIVDADSVAAPGFAEALAAVDDLRHCAVQAWFGTGNVSDSWLTRLGALFEDVRYAGQFRLKAAAGLNVPLTGNGMCLGCDLLARHGWAAHGLTEDTELYARYTLLGVRVRFAPDARLLAQEARDLGEASVQRRRWQAGRLQALRRYGVQALRTPSVGLRQRLDLLAELGFPGPVVHTAVGLGAGIPLILTGGPARVTGALLVLATVPTFVWTLRALTRRADRLQLTLDLLCLPAYAAWRILAALASVLLLLRPRWTRTPRHAPP